MAGDPRAGPRAIAPDGSWKATAPRTVMSAAPGDSLQLPDDGMVEIPDDGQDEPNTGPGPFRLATENLVAPIR